MKKCNTKRRQERQLLELEDNEKNVLFPLDHLLTWMIIGLFSAVSTAIKSRVFTEKLFEKQYKIAYVSSFIRLSVTGPTLTWSCRRDWCRMINELVPVPYFMFLRAPYIQSQREPVWSVPDCVDFNSSGSYGKITWHYFTSAPDLSGSE